MEGRLRSTNFARPVAQDAGGLIFVSVVMFNVICRLVFTESVYSRRNYDDLLTVCADKNNAVNKSM